MSTAEQHDRAVDSLTAALRAFFAPRATWTVLSRARWQPLTEFLAVCYTFDAMIVASDAKLEWDATRKCFGPDIQPVTIFDVVSKQRYDVDELFDKGDVLPRAGVYEYLLWDPSEECFRPPLQAWRIRESVFRPVRSCSRGVFFSAAGFRMDIRGSEVELRPCGDPYIEEELFTCQQLLEARQRGGGRPGVIDGLTSKIERLRAQLTRTNP